MTKDNRPHKGVSKSNVTASATAAATTRRQASQQQANKLDAPAAASIGVVSVSTSARYIDSRLKQFCLR